jgi:CHAD domain-containing protein
VPASEPGSQSTSSRFESFGRKLDEQFGNVAPRVEEEVKKVIAYLNDEVVPQVRQSSSEALRTASEHLNRLAEHLDRARGPKS